MNWCPPPQQCPPSSDNAIIFGSVIVAAAVLLSSENGQAILRNRWRSLSVALLFLCGACFEIKRDPLLIFKTNAARLLRETSLTRGHYYTNAALLLVFGPPSYFMEALDVDPLGKVAIPTMVILIIPWWYYYLYPFVRTTWRELNDAFKRFASLDILYDILYWGALAAACYAIETWWK